MKKKLSLIILAIVLLVVVIVMIYRPIAGNSYFQEGYDNLIAIDYNSAERSFTRANKLTPNDIAWFNKYANGYIDRNAFDYAETKIAEALAIDDDNFETKMTEGRYFQQRAEFEMSAELYMEGEALYNAMLQSKYSKKEKLQIYDAKGLLQISRASILGERRYYASAYETYKQMIEEYGDNITARKRGMLINIYTDNYDNVRSQASKIDSFKKGYFDDEVYPEYARYLLDKGEFQESRVLLEKILSEYPDNILALVTLADYYGRINNNAMMADILTSVLALYDGEPHKSGREYVHNMLGQYYYIEGNYTNALAEFENAVAINTRYPDANYNLGNIYYYHKDDYEKALEYYQVAYDNMFEQYKPAVLSFNLGWLYYRNKEYESAFEYFYDIYDFEQNNVVLNYALGNSLMAIDKNELAYDFYIDALALLLKNRDSFGTLYIVRAKEFETLNYLASLYNNIGVANAKMYAATRSSKYDRDAFQNFVRASELLNQVKAARGDLTREAGRIVNVDSQSTAIATYNLLVLQSGTPSYNRILLDNYIPKDLYYIGQKPFESGR